MKEDRGVQELHIRLTLNPYVQNTRVCRFLCFHFQADPPPPLLHPSRKWLIQRLSSTPGVTWNGAEIGGRRWQK